jgi:hypothetical protein
MLTGLLGVRLMLLMGRSVPVPAPPEAAAALSRIEVTNSMEGQDGFQITFTAGKDRTGDYPLLALGALEPLSRVSIGVVLGASPEMLIDGVITHHQFNLSAEPGASTFTVTGRDISHMLDLEERNGAFPNQPDSVIVTRLLGSYAQYGLVPVVTPTTDVPIQVQRVPRQAETDLQCIRRLARQNGFVFYVEPKAPGATAAYWGREPRAGLPQPALTVNMGSWTNAEISGASLDAMAPVESRGLFIEPFSKMSFPIPSLPSLRMPPLSAAAAPALRTELVRDAANRDTGQAALAALARTSEAPDPVRLEGRVDTVRYGHVLRARQLVGVRGVGRAYAGNYLVRRVTHAIGGGTYTQSFTISREGTGALVPVVRP